MRSYWIILAVALGMSGGAMSSAVAQDASAVKAAFVIAFTDLVAWPSAPPGYAIGIEGDSAVGDAIEKLSVMIKGKTIHVKSVTESDMAGCQIVYMSTYSAVTIRPGILTVGEGEDFTVNGGIIGFVIRNGKVRFIINREAADRAGIKISPRLLSMAAS